METPMTAATERKTPYEPPKAVFVPLQIEERLMACAKKNAPCKDVGGQHTS
jgi:hypothetical protein